MAVWGPCFLYIPNRNQISYHWGISHPVAYGGSVYVPITKIKHYHQKEMEGWTLRYGGTKLWKIFLTKLRQGDLFSRRTGAQATRHQFLKRLPATFVSTTYYRKFATRASLPVAWDIPCVTRRFEVRPLDIQSERTSRDDNPDAITSSRNVQFPQGCDPWFLAKA